MEQMLTTLLRELRQNADATWAASEKKYHKSSREHWGIRAPIGRAIVQSFAKHLDEGQLLTLAEKLWKTEVFDLMVCAERLLATPRIKPSQALWRLVLAFLERVDGWALEDTLAGAAQKCILAEERLLDQVEEWTEQPALWKRRAALVYTLPYAKSTARDPDRMLMWASSYACDQEWFIQKAIGWWLRTLSKNRPERVITFLERHSTQLRTVAKTEATKYIKAGAGLHPVCQAGQRV